MTSTPATVTVILDRIHAINQLLTAPYKAARYFPQNLDSARLPLLVPVFGANQRSGNSQDQRINRRSFTIIGFCGSFTQGLPTESAQKIAEQMVTDVENLYDARNRLQLNGSNDAPDFIVHSDYDADTGLIQYPGTEYAAVLFTLNVESDRLVTVL